MKKCKLGEKGREGDMIHFYNFRTLSISWERYLRHESCIVNRQIGVVDSKYRVVGDPLFIGHVTQPFFPPKSLNN